jgi:hypothetical protein
MCTLSFQGKGYSAAFVNNYQQIVNALTDSTQIEVVHYTDDICSPCPHKRESNCVKQEKIALLDEQHQKALNLTQNTLSWKDAKNLIKQNMTLEKFHHMCSPCEWKKYGMCEQALTDFLAQE